MNRWRRLCRLDDLPHDAAIGFPGGLFALHLREGVTIYRNACPHLGVPLDWLPGKFLGADGETIICAMHGATFRLQDGLCLRGPCRGERLTRVPCEVRDGVVSVPCDADLPNDGEDTPPDKT